MEYKIYQRKSDNCYALKFVVWEIFGLKVWSWYTANKNGDCRDGYDVLWFKDKDELMISFESYLMRHRKDISEITLVTEGVLTFR
jgi:hypothetical protein